MSDGQLKVIDLKGAKVCDAAVQGPDVTFSNPDIRWTWVLDARIPPYTSMTEQEVIHRAEHANKRYILVGTH